MRKNIYKILGSAALAIISFWLLAQETLADVQFDPGGNIKKSLDLPDKSPVDITIRTIQWVLGILGLIAVIMVLFGGFMWMTSAGNEERLRKAKEILKAAIIGLVIILLSWSLVTFVFDRVSNVSQ